MNNLHQRLTQKYHFYHIWHQTKHHNKIHWGVFMLFSFFVSILLLNPLELNLKKDNNKDNNNNSLSNIVVQKKEAKATYAPPPGSPLANKEHPRLFFTAKDLLALMDKLKTQYKTELQDFVNLMDASFNDDIVAKTQSARSYDAMNYAFLYLVDPGQMAPTFTFGHTRNEYGQKAIAHGLVIADDVLAGKITAESYQGDVGSEPISMAMALVYDWDYPLLVIQEKQKFADAFIKIYQIRIRQPGVQLSEGTMSKNYSGPVGGLAIWGDDLDNNTGNYYSNNSQQLLDLVKTDWIDGIYASLNYFYDKSGWRESWSYNSMAWPNVIFFTGMLSSSLGQDYFYNTGYLRYHPLFFLYSIRPYSYNGENYLIRYDTMTEKGVTQELLYYSKMLHGATGSLTFDSNMASLAKWIIGQGYGSPINNSRHNINYYYLFYQFIWGSKNVIPKSPQDLNLPIAQKFGSGQFIMRTGFTKPSDTLIEFWAPKFYILPGGHPSPDFASFAIEKYGKLALNAGNNKTITIEGKNAPTFSTAVKSSMFHNVIGVYKPGEISTKYDKRNVMGYRDGGFDETANKPTDPAYQDGGSNQVGELKAEELNTGNYSYINYDYSRAWPTSKVSYANREFVYLNPTVTSNKEFVVVFDRIASIDPSYKKRWLLWSSFEPEGNGTFTQDPTVAWKWESKNSETMKITNNYGTHHGRLFSKTLLPNSFKINKTGGPGHEFTDADYINVDVDFNSQNYGQLTDAQAAWIGAWRTEVESTTNQKDDFFFHVLEIGDSNTLTAMTNTTRIDGDTMVGALIDDPITPRIVLFSNNQTGAAVSSATYTANYSSTLTGKHLLAGITPGTYDIYKNGVKILTGITSQTGKNTLAFESTGGSTFSIVQTGIAPPVYQCSDSIDNDGDGKTDYPSDTGCSSATDNDETNPSDITSPSTPTSLTAAPISFSQINLSWTASTDDVGVIGYKIYRCQGTGCTPTTQIATSATNSYSNTGLTPSTVYTYAVSAYDAAGNESAKSQSISVTTLSQFKQTDFNKDGLVNQQDFDILKQDWARTDKPKSDLNQDGIVDSRDLGIMMSEWTR